MQIGFTVPMHGPLIEPSVVSRIVTEGEALGFDYVSLGDHIMMPRSLESRAPSTATGQFPAGSQSSRLEQLTTTAYIAALTRKLRFVLSVMVVPHRPAVLTAKVLATIDYLSHGRLTLGIGVGWCREEFEAIGAPPFDDRGNVTDEWMAVCRELWSADEPKFAGKYIHFDEVVFLPKPIQSPIPIWVGGESGPALRRTARYANCWYPLSTNPKFPLNTVSRFKAGLERLRVYCEKGSRDPKDVAVALRVALGPGTRQRTTIDGEPDMFSGGESDWVGDFHELQALGVSAVDVRLFGYTPSEGLTEAIDHMRRFHDGVMAKL
jgi:probable F420-dependent oxidoreductase